MPSRCPEFFLWSAMTRTNATVEKTSQALDSMAPVLRDLPMVAVMKNFQNRGWHIWCYLNAHDIQTNSNAPQDLGIFGRGISAQWFDGQNTECDKVQYSSWLSRRKRFSHGCEAWWQASQVADDLVSVLIECPNKSHRVFKLWTVHPVNDGK